MKYTRGRYRTRWTDRTEPSLNGQSKLSRPRKQLTIVDVGEPFQSRGKHFMRALHVYSINALTSYFNIVGSQCFFLF